MTTDTAPSDWYVEARRRAVAAGRRRRNRTECTEWPEFAPPVALSEGPLGEIQAADREIARLTAVRARAVARFAASRPATENRAQGAPGAMSAERWAARPACLRAVSEWAAQELVVALSLGAQASESLLSRSLDLVHRLPGTLAALEAGALHPGHLWTMLDKVAPIEDATIRAEVEAALLRWAAGRVVAPAQLNVKARREVARRDVRTAARRLEKALKTRGIHLRPHDADGMATVTVVATMPEAQALYRALVACAESLDEDDDPRTRGQKMVDCLLDLVLRPGESDLPPVQVLLTVVASIATLAGGDETGEIDGQVVPADMVRQLLAALTGAGPGLLTDPDPDPDPQPQPQPPSYPTGAMGWEEREQRELESWWAEMERRVLTGELVDPDPEPCPPSSESDDRPLERDLWPDHGWMNSPGGSSSAPEDRPAPDVEDRTPSPSDGPPQPSHTDPGGSQLIDDQPSEQPGEPRWWSDADRTVDDAGQRWRRPAAPWRGPSARSAPPRQPTPRTRPPGRRAPVDA